MTDFFFGNLVLQCQSFFHMFHSPLSIQEVLAMAVILKENRKKTVEFGNFLTASFVNGSSFFLKKKH